MGGEIQLFDENGKQKTKNTYIPLVISIIPSTAFTKGGKCLSEINAV